MHFWWTIRARNREERTRVRGEEMIVVERKDFNRQQRGGYELYKKRRWSSWWRRRREEEELILSKSESGFGCEEIGADLSRVWSLEEKSTVAAYLSRVWSPEEKSTVAMDPSWVAEVDCKRVWLEVWTNPSWVWEIKVDPGWDELSGSSWRCESAENWVKSVDSLQIQSVPYLGKDEDRAWRNGGREMIRRRRGRRRRQWWMTPAMKSTQSAERRSGHWRRSRPRDHYWRWPQIVTANEEEEAGGDLKEQVGQKSDRVRKLDAPWLLQIGGENRGRRRATVVIRACGYEDRARGCRHS